jgi:hypothetical protein
MLSLVIISLFKWGDYFSGELFINLLVWNVYTGEYTFSIIIDLEIMFKKNDFGII